MIVGFTGTREGMTERQKVFFVERLAALGPEQFHFGDDDGSDREAFDLVRIHYPRCWTVSHPPENDAHRAFCKADEIREPKPYLVRNLAISVCAEELVAAPKTLVEEIRSGTWSTVRYARKAGKSVWLLHP